MRKVSVSIKLDRSRHDELAQIALVESVEQRRRVPLTQLIRRALDHMYPSSPRKEDKAENDRNAQ